MGRFQDYQNFKIMNSIFGHFITVVVMIKYLIPWVLIIECSQDDWIQDGYIYLVDEEELSVEQISEGYCWFKARHMKYHIIPD